MVQKAGLVFQYNGLFKSRAAIWLFHFPLFRHRAHSDIGLFNHRPVHGLRLLDRILNHGFHLSFLYRFSCAL